MATSVNPDQSPSITNESQAQGTSELYRFGTSPNTRTAISQKVRILTPSVGSHNGTLGQIGVLGTFNVSMNRATEPVRGIGFGDKIAELVPNVQDVVSINWERALLYLSNMFQATGYKGGVDGTVRTLSHHRWPFDVKEELVFSELASDNVPVSQNATENPGYSAIPVVPENPQTRNVLITMYEACWIVSCSRNIGKDQSIIMESGDFNVTDVHAGGTSIGTYNELFQGGGAKENTLRYRPAQ